MSRVSRRYLLGATGASLILPRLESMHQSARASGDDAASESLSERPRRMVCIGNMLGFYPEGYRPTASGELPASEAGGHARYTELTDFSWGRSTAPLASVADHVSILTGLDHGLSGGHFAIHAFLSGVRQIDARTRPDANVTVDQIAAEWVGGRTRFPSLTIGSESGIHGGCQISWTRTGTRVPPIPGPAQLFEQLFVGTAPDQKAAAEEKFRTKGSVLDFVSSEAGSLARRLNNEDRQKLDEYLTSVRDVEHRLALRRQWIDVPKPVAPMDPPKNRNMVQDLPLLYELIRLALQTDSTRVATLEIGGDFEPKDLGISGGYHGLSHHGQLEDRIESLITLETYQIEQFAKFVQSLADTRDESGSLLDHTEVLFGSGMGNANSHTNTDLPIVLAGGRGRHGRWLRFDEKGAGRPPLCNLFVSMLQNMGLERDTFGTGTGTLRGLA